MMPGPRSPRASNGHAPRGDEPDKESELSEAWRRVRGRVPEIAQQAMRYASVQMDRGRLSLRKALLRAALAAWIGVAALAGTIIGVLMLARGLSGGLGALCGGPPWLGEALASVALLGAMAAGVAIWHARGRRRRWLALVRRYGQPTVPERSSAAHHAHLDPQPPDL